MTEQESRRGKSRRERVEFARSRDILDVANELQMELVRSGRDYRWKEHDSLVISPDKNLWKWFSRNTGGDAISLVETIKEVSFNQSVDFLNDGNFKEFQMVESPQEDFKYYLEKYEQPLSAGRDYLRNQRGLSDETIDYFLEQGVLAQANAKLDYFAEGTGGVTTNAIEPVIVFKSLSSSGEVVGASLQGIQENWEKWPKHGYAKVIMKNSDPMTGIHVDIGSPKRLIFTESPIDLMSYYELHKDSLQDVRLVSMDGLKESTIGRHLSQIQAEISGKPLRWTPEQLADGLQVAIDHHFFEDGKNADLITLALDNDKAGRTFIQELEAKGAVINSDLPELKPGQDKTDWNDVLKNQQEEKPDNSRLAQARRKLERLKGEQDEAISRAYSHQALTNGQPVNDKRGGASFMRKQEQIEGQVFSKMDEIRQQEERVERLEHQQHLKEMGLNRQGSGLEMSVQNIPRIREELEKAKRGESFFTKATLKRYQEELTRLEAISEQMDKTSIQPATQALIDEGLVNQWQKQPNTYFVKGLRRVALELTEEGEFQLSSQTKYHPKTDEERLKVDELLAKQAQGNIGVKPMIQEERSSVPPELFVAFDFTENPNLSQKFSSGDVIPYKDFIAQLYEENNLRMLSLGYDKTYFALQDEKGSRLTDDFRYDIGSEDSDLSTQLGETLPTPYLEQAQKADHDYQSQISAEENVQTESVESEEKAPESSQEQMNDRTSGGTGSLQPKAEGSTSPVLETSTFEQTVTSHPTSSYPYLQFSTNYDKVQRRIANYHPITPADLRRLNQYAPSIQSTAFWYLNELADSKISFVYADHGEENVLQVTFQKDNFIHLSGIRPFEEGKGAANFLDDIANGHGHYDGMLISNAIKDKLQVLPMLRDILDPHSFVLDDLSSVEKLHSLNMNEAIKAKDEDFLLLFKDIGDEKIPASLMKLKGELETNVKLLDEKIILGVYRERDGHIEQLSINEKYVKDKGAKMLSVLKNKQYEEVSKEIEQTISTVREEFEKSQEEEIKLKEQGHNKQELKRDADADGVSDEEELLQGTNPYDFRSKPGSKPEVEEGLQVEEVVLATGSLAVADFIQNKDMAGLSRHLKEGIKEFLDSDKYRDYLTKMSQLNNYSNRNLRLILAQNPEARQVASFKQWKENFGRYVKKGEKALRIFKPMTKIKKDENNQPILDKNGKPETVTFFGLVPVFDVSQTEGKEMPKAAEVKEQLTDLDYANLYRALMAIAKENDVSVRFEEMENNKHGYYSVPENQIVLRSNEMNKAQIIKTFLHEMAHAELHHADNPQKENLTRSTAELQAESVAYVVSSYYGIDTSEYSFNYLSGWSADKETLADLEAQLDIVQQEAKSLMVRMDQALEQLRLSQEKQTKRSFEQKLEKFKDQSKQAVEDHKQELKADAQSKKEKGFSK